MIRKPAVAGYFYPSNSRELLSEIRDYMPSVGSQDAIGAICPHAGYVYSGSVAGEVYSKIKPKEIYIILSPNHTGYGSNISVMTEGDWEIPLGKLSIHSELAKKIVEKASVASEDIKAHIYEHSVEVQLPFIFVLNKEAQIVPITIKMLSLEECLILAQGIAEAIDNLQVKDKVIIISSTDMSHYLADEEARKIDALAIDRIKNFDPSGLYRTVVEHKISMCGVIPTVTMLYASKILGASKVRVIKYTTSAEVSRDYSKVVGYLGAIVL